MFPLRAKMAKRYIVLQVLTQSCKWVRNHACARQSALLLKSVKGKIKVSLQQATKAQRGYRSIALLFFNLGARWGGWPTPHPDRFTPGKDPVAVVMKAGWAS
jgi:hypothetical protein